MYLDFTQGCAQKISSTFGLRTFINSLVLWRAPSVYTSANHFISGYIDKIRISVFASAFFLFVLFIYLYKNSKHTEMELERAEYLNNIFGYLWLFFH
jgi:hypothetical protein